MSEIFIDHQAPWVGVPEDFPVAGRWATAADWANELVAFVAERLGEPSAEHRALAVEYLESVALTREQRMASRAYVAVEAWDGRIYVVDMAIVPSEMLGSMGVEEFAGALDESAVEKPYVEPFISDTGVSGVRVFRFHNKKELDGLVARIDFVFAVPGGMVRLMTATTDLVGFDRVQPLLTELARTVRIEV